MLMRVKLQLLLASNAFLQKKKHKHNVIYMYPYIIEFLHIIL